MCFDLFILLKFIFSLVFSFIFINFCYFILQVIQHLERAQKEKQACLGSPHFLFLILLFLSLRTMTMISVGGSLLFCVLVSFIAFALIINVSFMCLHYFQFFLLLFIRILGVGFLLLISIYIFKFLQPILMMSRVHCCDFLVHMF